MNLSSELDINLTMPRFGSQNTNTLNHNNSARHYSQSPPARTQRSLETMSVVNASTVQRGMNKRYSIPNSQEGRSPHTSQRNQMVNVKSQNIGLFGSEHDLYSNTFKDNQTTQMSNQYLPKMQIDHQNIRMITSNSNLSINPIAVHTQVYDEQQRNQKNVSHPAMSQKFPLYNNFNEGTSFIVTNQEVSKVSS